MIAIEKGDDRLTLRFSAGRSVTALGIVLPFVGLAGLALLVFLPRTATLECSRASGRCIIHERSHVKAKLKGELAVADLRGAKVDKNKDGTSLMLETTTGDRALALGRRFNYKEVTDRQTEGAKAIQRYVADPSIDKLEVSVPRRHGENAIWGGIISCWLLALACMLYRRRGTVTFTRDEATWESFGWLGTRRGRWPMTDVRAVATTMPSYYESAIVLELADGKKQLVIRQYRSPRGERFIKEGAAALKAFLEARAA